jgi:hypothetical protein
MLPVIFCPPRYQWPRSQLMGRDKAGSDAVHFQRGGFMNGPDKQAKNVAG